MYSVPFLMDSGTKVGAGSEYSLRQVKFVIIIIGAVRVLALTLFYVINWSFL